MIQVFLFFLNTEAYSKFFQDIRKGKRRDAHTHKWTQNTDFIPKQREKS